MMENGFNVKSMVKEQISLLTATNIWDNTRMENQMAMGHILGTLEVSMKENF